MKVRIKIENALKHLHECEYRNHTAGAQSLAGALACKIEESTNLLELLLAQNLINDQDGTYQLTESGRKYAREVIRAHRLYETYLATKTGLAEAEWHRQAEKMEHRLSEKHLEQIAKELGHPRYDPHGDPIPTAKGELLENRDRSIIAYPENWEGRIIHLEDEPTIFYQELVDAGLAPEMRLKLIQKCHDTLFLNVEGKDVKLSRSAATNLMVAPFLTDTSFDSNVQRLSDLKLHQSGTIAELSPAIRGAERNRMLDLGIVPGTQVTSVLESPGKGPKAFQIRGATIALRREQTDKILIHIIG